MRSAALIIVLLILLTISASSADGIVNGGFETRDLRGWTIAGTASVTTSAWHGGYVAAQVGDTGPTNGDSSISQTFAVPAGGGTLSFWYKAVCPDSVLYSWATATLVDSTTRATTVLLPRTCTNDGRWRLVTSDLSANAGHSVILTLLSHDDNYPTDPTYTLYDDVTFTSTAVAGNDFSVASNPTTLTLLPGASGSSTISSAVTSGSTQSVSLSVSGMPSGASASFNTSSLTAGNSSSLLINAGTALPGTYTLTVTGTGTSATHTTTVAVTITPIGYLNGPPAIVNGGFESGDLRGWTVTSTGGVTTTGHSGNYAAQVGATSATDGDSSISQTFAVPAGGGTLSFWYKAVCPDVVNYDWATATLYDSTTRIITVLLPRTCSNDGRWRQVTANLLADAGHSVTLTLLSHDDNYPTDPTYTLYDDVTFTSTAVAGNDFSVASNPTTLTLLPGASGSSTISSAVTSGSTQAVSLSVSGMPSGASATFNPSSLTAGNSSSLLINAGTAQTGTYTLTVTAAGTSATHTTIITVTIIATVTAPPAIVNGGFETRDLRGWTMAGTASVTTNAWHGGYVAAQVGASSATVGDSSISQTFAVPAGGGTLSFWYMLSCPDVVNYDWATATLADNTTRTTTVLLPRTCTNDGRWRQVTTNLFANAGHSVTLTLVSHDDDYSTDPTYTLYDDISLTSITTTSLPPATVNTPYSATLAASGVTSPYVWSAVGLPSGLSLSASGVLSGTPIQSGQFTLVVQIADSSSSSQVASTQLSLTVSGATPSQSLIITANSLPGGNLTFPYSAIVSAAGGAPPYSWTITSGSLPSGLTIDRSTSLISGMPTQAGQFTSTVQVSDSASPAAKAVQQFTVTISGASSAAKDWPVSCGGDIQAAITNASCGDTITIQAGCTYNLPYGLTLPVKSGGSCTGTSSDYITVRSSNYASLPVGRVAPADAINMPKLVTTDTYDFKGVISLASNASYWRLLGLEMTNDTGNSTINTMVSLSGGSNLIADRNFIHPKEYPNSTPPYNTSGRFGIVADSSNVTISNNYIAGFHGTPMGAGAGATEVNSYAVLVELGGPISIDNNYLEAWYAPLFIGGVDPAPTIFTTVASSPAPTAGQASPLGTATVASTTGLSVGMAIALKMPWNYPAVGVCSWGGDGSVATVRTCTPHGFLNGWNVGISSVNDNVDGTYGPITVVDSTHFTYVSEKAGSYAGKGVTGHAYCKGLDYMPCWGTTIVRSITGNSITFDPLVGVDSYGTSGGGTRVTIVNVSPSAIPLSGSSSRVNISGPMPSNISFTRNYVYIDPGFGSWQRQNNGNHPKGFAEIKMCDTCVFEGNVFDGYPSVFAFSTNNQSGGAPWSAVRNITFQNNWARSVSWGILLSLSDGYYISDPGDNVTITNNLFERFDLSAASGADPLFIGPSHAGRNITISHNTALEGFYNGTCNGDLSTLNCPTSNEASYSSSAEGIIPNMTFMDNLLSWGNYGLNCFSPIQPAYLVGSCWSTLVEGGNIWVTNVNPPNDLTRLLSNFPHSQVLSNWAAVQFNNPATHDFRLKATSPGHNAATNGTDVGADMTVLVNALGSDNPHP